MKPPATPAGMRCWASNDIALNEASFDEAIPLARGIAMTFFNLIMAEAALLRNAADVNMSATMPMWHRPLMVYSGGFSRLWHAVAN